MKKLFILIVLNLFFIVPSFSQKAELVKNIRVLYVEQDIETPFSVECENFETLFSGQFKEIVIRNPKDISLFIKCQKHLSFSKNKNRLDVRVKLYYNNYSKKFNTLCMDSEGNIEINGRLILFNKKLVELVFSWCNYVRSVAQGCQAGLDKLAILPHFGARL